MKQEVRKLIEDNFELAFVMSRVMAKKYRLFGDDREELLSAAYVGLCEAAHRYDPEKGASFKTFASLRIRGEMLDQARLKHGLSRTLYNHLNKAESATQFTSYESRNLKGLVSRICAEDTFGYDAISSDGSSNLELVYRSGFVNPEADLIEKDTSKYIRSLISRLDEKQRKVIQGRYFEEVGIDAMAKSLGDLSKATVSRMHTRALDSLRRLIADESIECSRNREVLR